MNLICRDAKQSDAAWLWSLYRELMRSAIDAQWDWDESFQKEMFALHLPASQFIIVGLENTDVAAYFTKTEDDCLWLSMLLVSRKFQSRGIGAQLLSRIVKSARLPVQSVKLTVLKSNPARGFYQKHGFLQIADNQHSVTMEHRCTANAEGGRAL